MGPGCEPVTEGRNGLSGVRDHAAASQERGTWRATGWIVPDAGEQGEVGAGAQGSVSMLRAQDSDLHSLGQRWGL